MNFFRDNVIFL